MESFITFPALTVRKKYYSTNQVTEDNQSFRCESCNKTVPNPVAKYIFNVKISDHSGELYVSTYNDFGIIILGLEADKLKKMKDLGKE
jgi:replication factor A1